MSKDREPAAAGTDSPPQSLKRSDLSGIVCSMSGYIEPKVLKGFRDSLPEQEILKRNTIRALEQVFSAFGFVPIDTPVLEYTEVLLGKGGGDTDKQVYRFTDHGGRDVAMRFDLTVPFARYGAAHEAELYLPFKRYHIAKAYRGENTQRGRYREFTQCDFDTIGTDSVSADFEILLVMERSFSALGIPEVTFRISHRGAFTGFLSTIGASESAVEILRTVDKLAKIGRDEVQRLLSEILAPRTQNAARILEFIERGATNAETLARMGKLAGNGNPGIERLERLFNLIDETGLSERFILDPSITRGLDYYTGIVYETFLNDLPGIGSVCSGGRYDNLASLYTKTKLPGVGSSIGLDRLLAALEELGTARERRSDTDLLILCLDDSMHGHYHALARRFRDSGVRTEVFFEKRKLPAQFQYAEKKGIPLVLFCGPEEKERGGMNVRVLASRESAEGLSFPEAISFVKERLAQEAQSAAGQAAPPEPVSRAADEI